MGRRQSKTLPNWGEFLIGRLWEKETAFLTEPPLLSKFLTDIH